MVMLATQQATGMPSNSAVKKIGLPKSNPVPDPNKGISLGSNATGLQPIKPTAMMSPTPINQSNSTPSQAPSEYATWKTKQDELFSKLEGLSNSQFSYNPETDPAYQAQRQLAQLRAKDANRSTMETMNDRGLLQSTVTNSQLDQNAQRAEQEAAAYIPEYRQQAYGQFQDRLKSAGELLGYATNRGDTQYNRDYQTGRDAVGDAFNEAQLTGTYQSPEARAQIDQLLELKRQAETKGITAEQRNALSQQADVIRSKLSSMGVDVSNLGANVNSSKANATAGVQTLASKQLERSNFESDRSFEFAKAQQEWQNIFNQAQFDESKAAKVWEQAFQEKSFAQSVKDAAASRGLQWASLNQNQQQFLAREAWDKKMYEDQQSWKQKEWDWMQDPKNPSNKKMQIDFTSEYQGLKQGLESGALPVDVAILEIQTMVKSGEINAAQAQQMINLATPYKSQQLNSRGTPSNSPSSGFDLNSLGTFGGGSYLGNLFK